MDNSTLSASKKYGNDEVKKVQIRLLEMAKEIHIIFEKNNIPYFINFGTLLGAVRHKGVIPWDDDFDIFLFDDTYEKAIKLLRDNLPEDMFLEDAESEPLYFHDWAHVKDMNSRAFCQLYPQDNIYSHNGISIDLYRTVKMKESDLDLYRAVENKKYIERKRKANIMSDEEYFAAVAAADKRIENAKINLSISSNSEIYGMVLKQEKMYADDVLPLKKYKFCDTEFWGPNDPDSILKYFYGNYMVLPAEKDRIPHYQYFDFFDEE